MDHDLRKQVFAWQDRGSRYLNSTEEKDLYGAYFSYFICLLIIAKDYANHSSRNCRSDDYSLIKSLFKAKNVDVLQSLDRSELHQITRDLAHRLEWSDEALGQSIIYVKQGSQLENKFRCTVADLNELANFWKGIDGESDCTGGRSTRASQVFTLLWQIRNNLFHGEKGYGLNGRIESDLQLLADACKLLEAITMALLRE